MPTLYLQIFHADIDTDDITESINNATWSCLAQSLTRRFRLLTNCGSCGSCFPEMEKWQWNKWNPTANQDTQYQSTYLIDHTHTVQGESLVNQEKTNRNRKEYFLCLRGNPKHSPKSGYWVHISKGHRSCAYFTLKKISHKHIFAVFGIVNKLDQFQTEPIPNFCLLSPLHITVLSKTWLTDLIFNNKMLPSKFKMYHTDGGTIGGDVKSCVSAQISSQLLALHSTLDLLLVELLIAPPIVLGCIRPNPADN